jgi:type I restriction enzyme M protein
MLSNSIKSDVAKLWDKFWSGGIANPLTAIEQISYLIFMKRLDEEDTKKKSDSEFLNLPFTSVFNGSDDDGIDNQTKRWSQFKHLKGDDMLKFMQEKVFPYIKNLNGSQPFTHHMKDAVFIIPKPSLLVEAVNIIDSIYENIEKDQKDGQTFQDTQGDIYEYLLSEIASAGKNGQFRTPRHIIQMICALVNPKLGDEICDPACGTGGFLLGAYQHIMTQYTSSENRFVDDNGIERGTTADKLTDSRQWQAIKEKTFYGYDFDSTMVRIGLMNLMLHGIDQPNIDYKDTLSKKFTDEDRFDIILANPPFKGSIDKGDINESLKINTTKTELLFINRIINLLRLGGKAGVIVPDGVLFGSSNAHKDLRKMLIEKCELQGVVSMPSGIFKPYAGVSTAVLIFVKGGETKNVWFYDMKSDGYTLDDKRSKTTENDIPNIIEKWSERNPEKDTDRKAKAFFVSRKEIENNSYDLSKNRYKELEYTEIKYDDPKVILEKIEELEEEIEIGITDLKKM